MKTKPRDELQLVLVVWSDITSNHSGWFESFKGLEPAISYTSGFLVEETKDVIKLASSIIPEAGDDRGDIYGHDTIIPKGVVLEVIPLRKRWRYRSKQPKR